MSIVAAAAKASNPIIAGASEIFGTGAGRMAFTTLGGGIYGGMTSESESATGVFSDVLRGAGMGAAVGAGINLAPDASRMAGRAGSRFAKRQFNKFSQRFKSPIGPRMANGQFNSLSSNGQLGPRRQFGEFFSHEKQGARRFAESKPFRLARWSMENPMAIAGGAAAAGIGMAYLQGKWNPDPRTGVSGSPTMQGVQMNANYDQQANASTLLQSNNYSLGRIGSTPQMMNRYHSALQESTVGLTQGLHRGRHGG